MRKDFMDMDLLELADAREVVEAYIALGVARARQDGRTWAQIAGHLGVTPQEAHRRYRWQDRKPKPAGD